MSMKEKETATKRQTKGREESTLDVLYRFSTNVEKMPSWYKGLPQSLLDQLKTLADSGWAHFDKEREAARKAKS